MAAARVSFAGGSRAIARLLFLIALLLAAPNAVARSQACVGPTQCCPPEIADKLESPVTVHLGVLLVGLYAVDDKAGTWNADFYLSESWQGTSGFSPVTEIVNEVARQTEQFDATEFKDGECTRTRRIRSTLQSSFNLHTFPFDHQHLTMEFSDAWFDAHAAAYAQRAAVSELDEEARTQLSNWKVDGTLDYRRTSRVIKEDAGNVQYDYATFDLPVRRHITFHLTKFFLPLLVIVVVALSVFWIDPADLNSRVAVGVTCLLTAIAFQLAEAGSLPEVAYLTLADRVYAISYVSLALGILLAVYGKALLQQGRPEAAAKLDRRSRVCFPMALVLAVTVSTLRAFTQ
jgi:hypothetical protein